MINRNLKVIINFIGEQPVPNYVPVKWAISNLGIEEVISFYTDRTENIKERLNKIYKDNFNLSVKDIKVAPYDIREITEEVEKVLKKTPMPLFNLTGGTKPMTFAGYQLAIQNKIPFLYFQSEGGQMVIRIYKVTDLYSAELYKRVTVADDIYNLEEYLSIHFDKYTKDQKRRGKTYFKDREIGEKIESEIIKALRGIECFKRVKIPPDIEIDLFVKDGHNVGIVEVKKTLKPPAVNQVALPSRQVRLGTYIRRFVVGGPPRNETDLKNIVNRAELVNAYIIQLKSIKGGSLSTEDQKLLVDRVKLWLGKPSKENFQKMKEELGIKD